jgi:hypothetical protein
MYNTDNSYYTHETFIVMEPDVAIDGFHCVLIVFPELRCRYFFYPMWLDSEHTGIGEGNFTMRFANERLWFSQWQANVSSYYSVAG